MSFVDLFLPRFELTREMVVTFFYLSAHSIGRRVAHSNFGKKAIPRNGREKA